MKRSLKTRCPRPAKQYALYLSRYLISEDYESLMDLFRNDMFIHRYEISHTPKGTKVTTNGTPEDNAAAQIALQTLVQSSVSSPTQSNKRLPINSQYSYSIHQCVADYLIDRRAEVVPKTISAFSTVLNQFQTFFGKNREINSITVDDYINWRNTDLDHLAPKSQDTKNNIMDVFFKWNIERKRVSENPVIKNKLSKKVRSDLQRDKGKDRKAYSNEQLQKIFDPNTRSSIKKPCMFWLPLMALYTGARLEELAMVELSSIKEYEHGNYQLTFSKVKNEESYRTIPIHPDLIKFGLLDYITDLKKIWKNVNHLFPYFKPVKGRYTHKFSQEYGQFKRKLNIPAEYDFHSFRATLIGCLEANSVEPQFARVYTGHATFYDEHQNKYVKKHEFFMHSISTQVLSKIDYQVSHKFNLPHGFTGYKKNQFDSFLTKVQNRSS